jgi:lysine N-acyltransferase
MPNLSYDKLPAMSTESFPVLHRLRADVRPEVAAVPAPPVPRVRHPFAVRVAQPADAELLSEWMNRPHLVSTWESDWPVWRWRRHLEAQLAGTYSVPVIGSVDGEAFAYLEFYRAARDSIATCYDDAHPHDLGLHAAIAEADSGNRGVASAVFPQVMDSVFAQDPQCRRMMFDPDHRNAVARRVCEVMGCTYLGEYDMPGRRMALYAFPRPNR